MAGLRLVDGTGGDDDDEEPEPEEDDTEPGEDRVTITRGPEGVLEVDTTCGSAETTDLIARAFVAFCLPSALVDERRT